MRRATATTDAVGNTSSVAYNPAGLIASSTDALGARARRSTTTWQEARGHHAPRRHHHVARLRRERPDDVGDGRPRDSPPRTSTTPWAARRPRSTRWADAPRPPTTRSGNITSTTNALGAHDRSTPTTHSRAQGRRPRTRSAEPCPRDTTPSGTSLDLDRRAGARDDVHVRPDEPRARPRCLTARSRSYGYNTMGDLVSVTDALGATVGYEYDPVGRQTAKIDEAGQRWTTEYDSAGNAMATVDPAGARTDDGVRRREPQGRDHGRARQPHLQHPRRGGRGGRRDGRARARHQLRLRRDGSRHVDGPARRHHQLLRLRRRGQHGVRRRTGADSPPRSSSTPSVARRRRWTRWVGVPRANTTLCGNVTATVDASGARTALAYDALSRLVSTTDALGGTTTTAYDAAVTS